MHRCNDAGLHRRNDAGLHRRNDDVTTLDCIDVTALECIDVTTLDADHRLMSLVLVTGILTVALDILTKLAKTVVTNCTVIINCINIILPNSAYAVESE